MEFNFPKEYSWYLVAVVFFLPYLLLVLIDPDWLPRFIGAFGLFFVIPLSFLGLVFGPVKNLGKEGKTIWPEYIIQRLGNKVYFATRVLILILTLTSFYFLTLPFAFDFFGVVANSSLKKDSGVITDIDSSSITGFLSKTIVFDNNNSATFRSIYFPFTYFKYGKTYEFIYLPNTRIILDAKLIE